MALTVLLAVVLLALLHRARLIRRFRRAIVAQHEAYRRGDYEGQLEAAEALKRSAHPAHLYFRGKALFELGRMEEAEVCLRQSSIEEYDGHCIALYKDELGQVLVEQQRYDEAIACFESGIPHWPQRGGCHRGIAATLLRQGDNAPESLGRAGPLDKLRSSAPAPAPTGDHVWLPPAFLKDSPLKFRLALSILILTGQDQSSFGWR